MKKLIFKCVRVFVFANAVAVLLSLTGWAARHATQHFWKLAVLPALLSLVFLFVGTVVTLGLVLWPKESEEE